MRNALLAHSGFTTLADGLGIALVALVVAWLPRRRLAAGGAAAGLAALAVAAWPGLGRVAETSLGAHMVQHLLLVALAPPLLALAWVLPGRRRHRPPSAGLALQRALLLPAAPLLLAVAHAVALWAWHLPRPYRAALHQPALHAVQHASFLLTALLLWFAVGLHARRRNALLAVLALFLTSAQGAALGALLTFAPIPLVPAGELTDQRVAGVLMWSVGGLVCTSAAAAVAVNLLTRPNAGQRTRAQCLRRALV